MNWDPLSATRMRIRTWTALFEEIGMVFWNSSWSKAMRGSPANIYLGPEERGYVRVLAEFASRLDVGVRSTPVVVAPSQHVRAYGLFSGNVAAAYLHHVQDHTTAVRDVTVTLDVPAGDGASAPLVAQWIDPSTGALLASAAVHAPRPTLQVPSFTVDLALLVTVPARSHQETSSYRLSGATFQEPS